MKLKTLILGILSIAFALTFQSCKQTETTTTTTSATITALNCSSATFSATATNGIVYAGTANVPYVGGNGVAYVAGTSIASTGVTGLTATLAAGTLATGAGNSTFTVSGTPSGAGTASFAISLGGQSCTLSLTVAAASTGTGTTTGSVSKVVELANAFLATLSTSQQSTVVLSLNLTNAKKWSNLPCGVGCRQGLAFSALSATQLAAAKAVIQAASGTTSNEGYSEFIQINSADDVLGTKSPGGYSSGFYIIAFLGTPSTTGKWMLQFGGHHYAQSVTYDAGSVVSTTPSHQGIEPKSWTSGGVTYAPLAEERDGMANMLASFTTAELTSAKITSTFSDVTMVPGSTTNTFPTTKLGVKVSTLSATAQAKVLAAMMPWLNDLDDASTAAFLKIYTNELANTYVTYASNSKGTAGDASTFFTTNTDYVRIDGPSVWIEFICQTGVVYPAEIHYHSVYRDHTRDYIGL
ncbi:MAG: DUF3500 domain-containing protein [Bacteroidota bacterium]